MRDFKAFCKNYRQLLVIAYFLVSTASVTANDKLGRSPANFVPDDDAIIVPMVIEKNFIDDFHAKHENKFKSARKKLRFWLQQEQYAKDYGLENTGMVNLPTAEEKQKFLQRNYLRFISKDVEKSTNKGLQNSLEKWTADDEIDAITAVELHEKVLIKARKKKGRSTLKASKSVKIGKDNFKFGFQPRVEIGMAKFTLTSKHFKARAWVGINGQQEINIEKRFKSTSTRAFVNYYIEETRLLAALDQKLTGHWSLRATHAKDFENFENINDTIITENNIVQLRFNMGF
jgi:hypothetical protein